MILCNEGCIPCCDFCLYVRHEFIPVDDKIVVGGPIGCLKHKDIEHQEIAEGCGYCDDYHCINAVEGSF